MEGRYFTQNVGFSQCSPEQTSNVSRNTLYQNNYYQDYSSSTIPRPNFSVPPPLSHHNQSASQSAHSVNYSQTGRQDWGPSVLVQGPSVSFYPNGEPTSYDRAEHCSKVTDASNVETDAQWVQNYLFHIGKAVCKDLPNLCYGKKSKLTIRDAKESVDVCVNIIRDLQSLENKLRCSVDTLNSEEWNNLFTIVELKKQHLSTTLNNLKNPVALDTLNMELKNRTKKRQAQTRKRTLIKQRKMEARLKREKLHLTIDAWLEEMQLSVEKVKSDESLKMQADLVLADVTRKSVEARRQLSLVSAMLKLRQLRIQAATNRGDRISVEQANIFENVIKNLQTFWTDQLKGYNLEEKGLRVMLEEETVVKRSGPLLCQTTFMEWQKVLFGAKARTENCYTLAERDVDFFVKVRRDWDKFHTIVAAPMATSIPIGWVMPLKPSSVQWEKLLVK